jgi:transposase
MLPGQILILDNASFHPPGRIRELLGRAGCEVLFLPPYSPDLNKIEQFWARLKHQVKKVLKESEGLFDAMTKALCILS